ncbi:ABC-type transport system involved in multi-copper enzyme maturation permease subunit [Saccharothrix ecbatanensis]|uniref:ABC-type transport system involved in multi-copper enzyme maturation permease subunit n=1 Tax=Saccharothrix ecbatanensis TaxID=1105145 RepID=A0A7W9HEE6_9PSEU|nr:ABC transporter permease subunit [Saccharothrix ecbatanensis]MBB5800431.1 ABC-type transport system involved in multi-copper enzyme maturation permease subunit [Saccharothrix ecbatanensis]
MTTTTTPFRSGAQVGRDGFGQLLRAEWTKFRTVRGWVIGLVAAALVTVLIGLFGAAASNISCSGPDGGKCAGMTPPIGPNGVPVNDHFSFAHRSLAGDGSITVRMTSLTAVSSSDDQDTASAMQPWTKAGIIIKESTTPGSQYAALAVTGEHGVRMQHNYTGDIAGTLSARPSWLRLTRSGDTITGHESADGANWDIVGTVRLPGLPSTVRAGMFAASPQHEVITESFASASGMSFPTRATAEFDRISLQGGWSDGTWTGEDIGGGPGDADGLQQTGDGVTVSGSGNIAPIVAGRGGLGMTVESGLVGAFAGLIAIIVVASTFMTSEYRRGLIRTSLSASPRRGRVLAAKAVVIGSVTFVTGLVASSVAVPLVRAVQRSKGHFMFTVPTATELRVVVGTAALLAVAAVFSLAVGTVLRRSAGAVSVVIVAIVLPYILAIASVLPTGPSDWLLRITPAAAFAVQQSLPEYAQVTASYTPADGYFPLGPLGGFAVLCAYTALALGVAAYVLRRRDA